MGKGSPGKDDGDLSGNYDELVQVQVGEPLYYPLEHGESVISRTLASAR